jgi:probable F420-dependent oxidoreductase
VREFRFSCNVFGVAGRAEFVDRCRLAERLGYDAIFAPDHVRAPAPFPVLVAAADATERIRVGTLVLNVGFWNPALLARDVATADLLTGGRLEIGLGAGYVKAEFDEVGIAWEPFGTRAGRLEETIKTLEHQFRTAVEPGFTGARAPQPVQRKGFGGYGPPLIVGGTGDRILTIAARHADVVAIAGAYQMRGKPAGVFRLGTAAETDERVRFTRVQAGDRADGLEWHILIQVVVETRDRRGAAEQIAAKSGHVLTPADILETPFILLGTVDEMADQIRDTRDRYGFTHLTVHDPYLESFAPVIAKLR